MCFISLDTIGTITEFGYFQVLQISELLQYNGACSDRSVVILLVFLASQLFVKKNVVSRIKIMVTSCCCGTLECFNLYPALFSSFSGSLKFP